MRIKICKKIYGQITKHLERSYPFEGAGYLLGISSVHERIVTEVLPIQNAWNESSQNDRFLIPPDEFLRVERHAEEKNIEIIGVFHSHPDANNQPSHFDKEWAMPWFSYFITTVNHGDAVQTRSWRLSDDRHEFIEEDLIFDSPKDNF